MRPFFILCCVLFTGTYAQAQYKSFSSILLDSIARNGRAFALTDTSFNQPDKIIIDSFGRSTAIFSSEPQSHPSASILLIDTFGLFTPANNGIYSGVQVQVANRMPSRAKQTAYNTLWIGGIATGKDNTLVIAFFQKRRNETVIYYLSVLGKVVKIIKTSGGVF